MFTITIKLLNAIRVDSSRSYKKGSFLDIQQLNSKIVCVMSTDKKAVEAG